MENEIGRDHRGFPFKEGQRLLYTDGRTKRLIPVTAVKRSDLKDNATVVEMRDGYRLVALNEELTA